MLTSCRLLAHAALIAALWLCAPLMAQRTSTAEAKTPVSIELVIAVDTSMSIDGAEYALLMNGIVSAFRSPIIVDIIKQHNGVAVTLFQWSSAVNQQYAVPWHLLTDQASILSFADAVEQVERDPKRHFTGLGNAINFGVRQITENTYHGRQTKIDVSGDGRSNTGVPPTQSGQSAEALGVVINGLPILTYAAAYSYDLVSYYRTDVIRGPGAFLEIADDYDDFARAFQRKLQRELAPFVSENSDPVRTRVEQAKNRSN